jgi:hypothetical protein
MRFDSQQGQEIFLFSTASRPALRPIQPPIQWVSFVPRGKAAETWSLPFTFTQWRGQDFVKLCLWFPHMSSWRLIKHRGNFTLHSLVQIHCTLNYKKFPQGNGTHEKQGDNAYCPYLVVTNTMKQIPSWKANSCSATLEIPRSLRNPKIYLHVHNNLSPYFLI